MTLICEDFDDYIVNGKPMHEWYESDGENVDYSKLGYKSNISTDPNLLLVDFGAFVINTEVTPTRYHKGIDLSRLAGTFYHDEPYDQQMSITCIDGDDVVNILFNNVEHATFTDLFLREFKLVAEDVYVSRETKHIMVSIAIKPQEVIVEYIKDYNNRIIRKR